MDRNIVYSKLSIPESSLIEGANQITFVAQGSGDVSLIDYVRVTYAHTYSADSNNLFASATGNQPVTNKGLHIESESEQSTLPVHLSRLKLQGTIDGDNNNYSISIDGAKRRNFAGVHS